MSSTMKLSYRKIVFAPGIVFLLLSLSCAPCRSVRVDSQPSGAYIYSCRPELAFPKMRPGEEGCWEKIGQTPLSTDSCSLTSELKARWEEEVLYLSDYHGQARIRFDFENGIASAGD